MTVDEVLGTLERLGTAKNREIYARHGAGENQFGVSFADLNKLKKRIGASHALARELWATGNTDARVLATMIGDPQAATSEELDAWVAAVRYHTLADLLSNYVASTPHARTKMQEWTESDAEFVAQAGYNLLAQAAIKDASLPDAWFEERLKEIEGRIRASPNRARYAMNGAVIAIGLRNAHLKQLALETAQRIGKVGVDHGETGCKTPDAAEYIERAFGRAAKKKAAEGRK